MWNKNVANMKKMAQTNRKKLKKKTKKTRSKQVNIMHMKITRNLRI